TQRGLAIYYVTKPSAFGPTPPDENEVINYYNSLGLGATQLYNRKRIYNHKKHEDVKLGRFSEDIDFHVHPPEHLGINALLPQANLQAASLPLTRACASSAIAALRKQGDRLHPTNPRIWPVRGSGQPIRGYHR